MTLEAFSYLNDSVIYFGKDHYNVEVPERLGNFREPWTQSGWKYKASSGLICSGEPGGNQAYD